MDRQTHVDERDAAEKYVPAEEIRFGVILNGGVSLAVWMGGAVLELDRLTKATRGSDAFSSLYGRILDIAGCNARADVISGTSAGGINGAALALSQVNKLAQLSSLRDVWVDKGQLETLLRKPFRGQPTSLLQGDEYFLPALNDALSKLASPADCLPSDTAPIDLTITTTVLRGNQTIDVDSMGQQLPQTLHAARFHWSRQRPEGDPFAAASLPQTARGLALAARCTASFPVAFEPVFVPVGQNASTVPNAAASVEEWLRPDMADVVEGWGDEMPIRDRSRFVVDGGLLANTPTAAALQAVEGMEVEGAVRRIMLMVYPHASVPDADPPDEINKPPTLTGTMSGLLGALTAQGGRTFVEEFNQHNRAAAARRGTRQDILCTIVAEHAHESAASRRTGAATGLDDLRAHYRRLRECLAGLDSAEHAHESAASRRTVASRLEDLAVDLLPHYRRLREWRAARDLATHVLALLSADQNTVALSGDLGFERVRQAAENAQRKWEQHHADPGQVSRPRMPYVPDALADSLGPHGTSDRASWGWGIAGALGAAEAGADLVRRMVWVLEAGDDYRAVQAAREKLAVTMASLREARRFTDEIWEAPASVARTLTPNEAYWTLRLAWYERLMLGVDDPQGLESRIQEVARLEAVRRQGQTGGTAADGQQRYEEVCRELIAKMRTGPDVPAPGSAGAIVHKTAMDVATTLLPVVKILDRRASAPDGQGGLEESMADLLAWRAVLHSEAPAPLTEEELLHRLLNLEVATSSLGEEVMTGAMLPVEVIQLSAQTANGFMAATRTADDKLAGMAVNRFGGFLKRSWRVNDWIWGRLDAATVLCSAVLQPLRLRRAAVIRGQLRGDISAARALAEQQVAKLVGPRELWLALESDPRAQEAHRRALTEMYAIFDPTTPESKLPASMPNLARLCAWALHLEIVGDELPDLARAVAADAVDGASARSNGAIFVSQYHDLIKDLQERPEPDLAEWYRRRMRALRAFDRAGIGREELQNEATSDQTMRTATSAAAVATTVLDSDRNGMAVAKPVTRTLRGGMLLPYWVVNALTSRAVVARSLALLGLAVGGVLLALALFGVLPSALAGPGAALGASALLLVFAYSALRTGTLLHGLVLLTPVAALTAFAVAQTKSAAAAASTAKAATQAGVTLLVVLGLVLGLMVLGSLPSSSRSVWAALDTVATREGLAIPTPPARPQSERDGLVHRGCLTTRFLYGVRRSWIRILGLLKSLKHLALLPFSLPSW